MSELATTKRGLHVWIPDIDLQADYDQPQTYQAEYAVNNSGGHTGRYCRVMIDHDATGTMTTGMGDTVVRVV